MGLRESFNYSDDPVMQAVKSGDVGYARKLFQETVWAGGKVVLSWDHLRAAVLKENRAMVKFLITWGATGTPEQIKELRYNHYVKLLRACGMKGELPQLPEEAHERATQGVSWKLYDVVTHLPQDAWRVLEGFEKNGAPEAVIAGATLRDAFNGVAVKSVDIFLLDRGGDKWKLIRKAFKAAGIDAGGAVGTDVVFGKDSKKVMNVWSMVAGPDKTPYRIAFIEEAVVSEGGNSFAGQLIGQFDFGFSQVAAARHPLACFGGLEVTAGEKIQVLVTQAFKDGVTAKEIRPVAGGVICTATQAELTQKYPGWKLCEADKKPATPPRVAAENRHWRSGWGAC